MSSERLPLTLAGKRFIFSFDPDDAAITVPGTFVETTPAFLFLNPTGSGKRVTFEDITVNLHTAPGSPVDLVAVLDPDDRLTGGASGTDRTPQIANMNLDSDKASVLTLDELSTATAEDADERFVGRARSPATEGASFGLAFDRSIMLMPGQTLLIYVFGTTTDITYAAEWVEEDF